METQADTRTSSTGALEASDKAAEAVAKTPRRVTLDYLRSQIVAGEYTLHGVLTVCVATCQNGYKLVGKSAPADPANFNEELGRKFALEDAERQLWPILGYQMCSMVSAEDAFAKVVPASTQAPPAQ